MWLYSVYPLRNSDRELSMMPPRPDRMPQLKYQLKMFNPLKVIWKLWWIQWLKQLSAWRGLQNTEFITTKWRNQFRLSVAGAGLFALCCVPFLSWCWRPLKLFPPNYEGTTTWRSPTTKILRKYYENATKILRTFVILFNDVLTFVTICVHIYICVSFVSQANK